MKVVKTDFYLSKSTEVLVFKSTQLPKVNFLFYVNELFYFCCNTCNTSEATYNALDLLNTQTNLKYLWNKAFRMLKTYRNKTSELTIKK